jgi:hypothetical protein
MEKLVRRHFRKEPGHLACRAGPIAYALLFTLVAFSTSGAQTLGNPAKVVRQYAFEKTGSENPNGTVREEIAVPAPTPDVAAVPLVDAVGSANREGAKKREGVTMMSNGPYLPITGPLPLRFSSTCKWPATLQANPPAPEAAAPAVAAAVSPVATPAESPPEPKSEPIRPASTPAVATSVNAPSAAAPVPTVLTADMVLGFLGDLPPAEARVSVRFEPALPQGARGSVGLGALSP